MSNLTLAETRTINLVTVDGYYGDKQAWFTRTQIGQVLEYANPQHAITLIHGKHKKRLDLFSRRSQFETPSGIQEGYVYNIRGVLEICRWSKQPKADEVMDKLYDMAEAVIRIGYYSSFSDEVLMDMLISRCRKNDGFVWNLNPNKIMKQIRAERVNDVKGAVNELWHRRSTLSKREFKTRLSFICGEKYTNLWLKMMDKYEKEEYFFEIYNDYKQGILTGRMACEHLDISYSTWRKRVKDMEMFGEILW